MPAHHLVADRRDHVAEGERAGFLRHPGVEDHLQQQVAQFVLQLAQLAAVDRIGDLVGFLDGVGGDAGEVLLQVPRATAGGIAQRRHDPEQGGDVASIVRPWIAHAGSIVRRAGSPRATKSPLSRPSRWL